MNGLGLCAGIGGLELGVSRAIGDSYRTVGYCEAEPAAIGQIRKLIGAGQLHDAPIHTDLRTFRGFQWRGVVDILTAGFPCQPFSTASRGRKVAIDLWPHVFRATTEIMPQYVFVENVQRGAIARACDDLGAIGYRVHAARVSSAQVGAPDRRVRWWALAYLDDPQQPTLAVDAQVAGVRAAASADRWLEIPDHILAMDAGLSNGLDRMKKLKMLGNSVNPIAAEVAFLWLLARFSS